MKHDQAIVLLATSEHWPPYFLFSNCKTTEFAIAFLAELQLCKFASQTAVNNCRLMMLPVSRTSPSISVTQLHKGEFRVYRS